MYTFVAVDATYEEAVAAAKLQSGTIATITSRSDSVVAVRAITGHTSSPVASADNGQFAWIGMRGTTAGTWRWQNTDLIGPFTNWGFGEPSVDAVTTQCGAVCLNLWTLGTRGQWKALPCTLKLPYVMQTPKPHGSSSSSDFKSITITVAVLLGLFLLASIIIVLRKVLLHDKKPQHRPRTTRRHAHTDSAEGPADEGTEMRNQSSHPSRKHHSKRRVHFPHGREEAGGEAVQADPERSATHSSGTDESPAPAVAVSQLCGSLTQAQARPSASKAKGTRTASGTRAPTPPLVREASSGATSQRRPFAVRESSGGSDERQVSEDTPATSAVILSDPPARQRAFSPHESEFADVSRNASNRATPQDSARSLTAAPASSAAVALHVDPSSETLEVLHSSNVVTPPPTTARQGEEDSANTINV